MGFSNLRLKKGRVLDVGCGDGIFSYELAIRGYDVYAIDTKDTRPRSLRHPRLKFFQEIVALDLIEHVVEDEKLLQVFNKHLVRGGFLIITTPNARRKVDLEFERRIGHVRKGYSAENLSGLLTRSNFKVEEIFFMDPFHCAYLLACLKNNFIRFSFFQCFTS